MFIVGTAIALVSTIGVAVADQYGGYMAARFFQGLGVSPASSVGMAVGMSSIVFLSFFFFPSSSCFGAKDKSMICSSIMNVDRN